MATQENRDVTAQLLEEAAGEIEQLRRVNLVLSQYRVHTERMLALFEGGPRPEQRQGMGVDMASRLRTVAKGFREPPQELPPEPEKS